MNKYFKLKSKRSEEINDFVDEIKEVIEDDINIISRNFIFIIF